MWPFTKSAKKADRSTEELHDRLDTVERQVRSLMLEWESTYNKLRAVVARLNKREERERESEQPADVSNVNGASREAGLRTQLAPRIRRNY